MQTPLMKAAVLTGPQSLQLRDVPIPPVTPGTVRIRVSACGVCGSDIHMWKQGHGWMPENADSFHMGHELCGLVTDPGGSDFAVGDRVVIWANLYCGACDMCQSGNEQLCRRVDGKNYIGFVCNGGYAQYCTAPVENVWALPPSVSDLAACLIDPLMVAHHAVKNAGITPGSRVLVSGSGIIAQLIGALAVRAGASTVAMSRIDDRQLAIARKNGDFNAFYHAADPGVIDAMRADTGGGFDLAFEAVGAAESLALCMAASRPGATVVLIGNSMSPTVPFALNDAVLRELTLKGSVSCTRREFEETIALLARGVIVAEHYVTDIFPLERIQEAFEKQSFSSEPFLKSVIRIP